ncbi:hypothetical protein [Paracoccus endophyticus]|uniref:hypothetical protein n=1 Tax=Paracoccus endophyticus TaxID=2233774 RepID=UPI000DD7795C|nr:hypothetical protein [Paracoccus endophyticus]
MAALLPDTTVLWTPSGQSQVLDARAAAAAGHRSVDGKLPPHGTYTVVKYYRLRIHPVKGKTPGNVLVIFDEAGNFARFAWNEAMQAWSSDQSAVEFSVAAGSYPFNSTMKKIVANSVRRAPSLSLAKYGSSDLPSGADSGSYFIEVASRPGLDQVIDVNPIQGTFTWRHANETDGLLFLTAPTQPPAPNVPDTSQFGYIFRDGMAQVALPYYGFNPRKVLVYPGGDQGILGSPGTTGVAYKDNPQQTFHGQLIFKFPRYDSGDWTRGQDPERSPNLPLGLTLVTIDAEMGNTHNAMISSLEDTMHSWSVSLGLSGGVEKMLTAGADGTYSSRVEQQKKTESRYNVSRNLDIRWVASIYTPSMTLHQQLVDAIKSLTASMLSESPRFDPAGGGKDPLPWDSFTMQFGSHYCHTMTQGSNSFSETRLSLSSETKAFETGVDLSSNVSAGIGEAGKADLTVEVKNNWSSKKMDEISTEDITSFAVGTSSPVAIFFDLRPLTELLGPVYFEFNPDDEWGRFAPFVWYDLRSRLAAHLETLGLNQPLGPEWTVDYTPRRVQVTAPKITLTLTKGGIESLNVSPGSITLGAADDPAESLYGDPAFLLVSTGQQSLDFADHDVPSDGSLLGAYAGPTCFIAVKPGETSVKAKVAVSLNIYDVYTDATGECASFFRTKMEFTRDVTLTYGQTETIENADQDCLLTMELVASDIGPLVKS